jgi:hypothetical protein
MSKASDKSCKERKKKNLQRSFSDNPFYGVTWRNVVEPNGPHVIICYAGKMRFACRVSKARIFRLIMFDTYFLSTAIRVARKSCNVKISNSEATYWST